MPDVIHSFEVSLLIFHLGVENAELLLYKVYRRNNLKDKSVSFIYIRVPFLLLFRETSVWLLINKYWVKWSETEVKMFPAHFFFFFFVNSLQNILSISIFGVAVILVGVLVVGYNNDAYIVSIKSVIYLSESQLRIFILKSPITIREGSSFIDQHCLSVTFTILNITSKK